MARRRGLTNEDILRELQRLDEIDSGNSDETSSSENEYYLSNKDRKSNSSNVEEAETSSQPLPKIKNPQKHGCGRSREVTSIKYRKQIHKSAQNVVPNFLSKENETCNESDSLHDNSKTNSQPSTSRTNLQGDGSTSDMFNSCEWKRRKSSIALSGPLPVGFKEISTDNTIWQVMEPSMTAGRCGIQNVLQETQGLTSYAERNICEDSVLSAWRLIFSNTMMRHIQQCTEAEAHRHLGKNTWSVSLEELDASFSIMYARGVYGAKNTPLNTLWSTVWGPPFFSQTMPRDRFKEILRFLRFDLKSGRSVHLKTDKFALASAIWNPFIKNSAACFKPGANLAVEEQLLPTKARCPFIQYIPSKPDKFGIKFWLLVCVDTKYILNGFPYTGSDSNRPVDQAVYENVVMHLTEGYLGKGRNITTDNYFTSLKLCEQLKSECTSLIGTLRKNCREVPPSAKLGKQPLHSTILYRKGLDISLTAYQGKMNENVLLLSSLHPTVTIDNNEKKTPETVNFYNQTKYGVHSVDQMLRMYTTKSGSRRWPIQVFFNILDMSAVNAWVLYKEVTGKQKLSRRNFILQLCEELRTPYVASKINAADTQILSQVVIKEHVTNKRLKCRVRRFCIGNHTKNSCVNCKKAVCGKCSSREVKCADCFNEGTK